MYLYAECIRAYFYYYFLKSSIHTVYFFEKKAVHEIVYLIYDKILLSVASVLQSSNQEECHKVEK